MHNQLFLMVRWEANLSVNDRYTHSGRPRLRGEVAAWQEELAWKVKEQMAQRDIEWPEDVSLVVDVEMRFPEDDRVRDADNYLKSIFDGLEMGLGIDDSQFIPYLRDVQIMPMSQAGFTIRVYAATFKGRGIKGFLAMHDDRSVIVLDKLLPAGWQDMRVCVNIGILREEET